MPSRLSVELTEQEYQKIANFVHKTSGIDLFDGKKDLMRARLAKIIHKKNFTSFGDYFNYVMSDSSGNEVILLLDALSTNLTSFYREPQHFQFMKNVMLPEFEEAAKIRGSNKLRLWSAACSSGEEPYTMAIIVKESSPYFAGGGDCKILATDLSTRVLAKASQGLYGPEAVKPIPHSTLTSFFSMEKSMKGNEYLYRVDSSIKQMVTFRRLNLIEPFPFSGNMDAIFCRNVMIYFDKPTISKLVDKFFNILNPGGYLFIGHSESLSGHDHKLQYMGPCIYKKV